MLRIDTKERGGRRRAVWIGTILFGFTTGLVSAQEVPEKEPETAQEDNVKTPEDQGVDLPNHEKKEKKQPTGTMPSPALSGYQETVVVTASRTEQPIHEAPSTMTVIGAKDIATAPADDYGDLLRTVPGLNVAQFNAFDVQFNTRQATGVLAQGQQILVDNRSVLYDFNGIFTFGSLPLDLGEIDRIEVVRGPGSAVWGAGATNGVVNIITKSPREMLGTSLTLGGGERGTAFGNLTSAGARGKVSWRVAETWYEQDDPYDRPTGTIPGTEGPANPGGTPYPPYLNSGTEQPKIDMRIDWDQNDRDTWSFSSGYARFTGIPYTPLGPFLYDGDSNAWYGRADWTRGSMHASAYFSALGTDGQFLLLTGPDGNLVRAGFAQKSYQMEFTDTRLVARRNILTYGASARMSRYDVDIAPKGDSRDDLGVFLQDDIAFSKKWRWLVGARVDDISLMGTVLSPRTSLMFAPVTGQTFHVSWNRAFRAPTIVQSYIDIVNTFPLTLETPTGPATIIIVTPTRENTELNEERVDTFEIGWVGDVSKRTLVTLSVYQDDIQDLIRFVPAEFYTSANPPPGWPLPPAILDIPPPNGFAGVLPAALQYQNIGSIKNRGVESSFEFRPTGKWRLWANASWQEDPKVYGIQQVPMPDGRLVYPINLPPNWRANAGAVWNVDRGWVDFSTNWQDEAFWTDVLDSRYWGPTEAFFQVNLGAGIRFARGKLALSMNVQNLFDERVQQHVWGDLLGRKVTAQVRWSF